MTVASGFNLIHAGFLPGDRVRADCGLFDHVGTVSRSGNVLAASAQFGGVREVAPHEFSGGRPIRNEGTVGLRTRGQVLQHIEQRLGEPYCLLTANCEHVNNEAHGMGRKSPQVAGIVVLMLAGVCAYLVPRR